MAWQNALVSMVRSLTGDMSDTPTYDDTYIQKAILTSFLIVAQEYELGQIYTVNFDSLQLSPDPTDPNSATFDPVAMALVTLKAACLLNLNSYQGAVGTGIRVRDGDSEVDTTGAFKGYSDIIRLGACASYERLLKTLSYGNVRGKAVMSPVSRYALGSRGIWDARGFFDGFNLSLGGYH